MKSFKRLLLASAIAMGSVHGANAIGAYPRPIVMKQPDGTTLLVRIQGDENYHFVTTSDGFMLKKDREGFFCYVDYDMKTGKRNAHTTSTNVTVRSARSWPTLWQHRP